MSHYNRFGKTSTSVLALYPGTVAADYDSGGAAGAANIEGALDRAVFLVAASLPPAVFRALTDVDAQEVVDYATANQTTWTLGIVPIVAGSLHLWLYPLPVPPGRQQGVSGYFSDDWSRPPAKGYSEVDPAEYGVVAATGAVTYSGRAVGVGERVFASYAVDHDNASFTSPMLGQIAVLGAAAELGTLLYSSATQEWALVTSYAARFAAMLAQLKDGSLVPDEVRKLKYFTEIERSSGEVRSVPFYRG